MNLWCIPKVVQPPPDVVCCQLLGPRPGLPASTDGCCVTEAATTQIRVLNDSYMFAKRLIPCDVLLSRICVVCLTSIKRAMGPLSACCNIVKSRTCSYAC
jgi:hypothetical protein